MSSLAYELESLCRRIWALRRDHAEEFEDFSNVGHASVISTWQARYGLWADTVLDLQEGQVEANKPQSWQQTSGSSNNDLTQLNSQCNGTSYEEQQPLDRFVPAGPVGSQQQYDPTFIHHPSGYNEPQGEIAQAPTARQEILRQSIQAGAPPQINQLGRPGFSNAYSQSEPVAPNNAFRNSDTSQGHQTPQSETMVPRNNSPGMGSRPAPRQNVAPNQTPRPGPNPNLQSGPSSRAGTPSNQNVIPRQNVLPAQQTPNLNNAPSRTQPNVRPSNNPNFQPDVQKGGQGQPIRQ